MNAQLAEATDTGTTVAEYGATALALADLRSRYDSVVFDVSSGKGMEQAKKGRAELREHRVSLEKERVRIKAPALDRCRQIDSEAKRITAELESLEQPIDAQIKAEEDRKANAKAEAERAEAERIAAVNARFDAIKSLPLRAVNARADEIRAVIAEAKAIDTASFPADLLQAAIFEQRMAVNALRAALDRREADDAEQVRIAADRAELERLRSEADAVRAEADRLAQVERDRVAGEEAKARQQAQAARDDQIRTEAAAAAVAQAEADRIAAAEAAAESQAEAVRQAEARAAQQAADAEHARKDAEARDTADREAREANKRHCGVINSKAAAAFVAAGLNEEAAKLAVIAIASGAVPAVSIRY